MSSRGFHLARGAIRVKFTIKCEMKDRWVPHFIAMLKRMERLGGIGSSRLVSLACGSPYWHGQPLASGRSRSVMCSAGLNRHSQCGHLIVIPCISLGALSYHSSVGTLLSACIIYPVTVLIANRFNHLGFSNQTLIYLELRPKVSIAV